MPKSGKLRDVSFLLQKFRAFLLGQERKTRNRSIEELSPRSQPQPKLPQATLSRLHNYPYYKRDARREVSPPAVVYDAVREKERRNVEENVKTEIEATGTSSKQTEVVKRNATTAKPISQEKDRSAEQKGKKGGKELGLTEKKQSVESEESSGKKESVKKVECDEKKDGGNLDPAEKKKSVETKGTSGKKESDKEDASDGKKEATADEKKGEKNRKLVECKETSGKNELDKVDECVEKKGEENRKLVEFKETSGKRKSEKESTCDEKKKSVESKETSGKNKDECDETKVEQNSKLIEFKESSGKNESEKEGKCDVKKEASADKKKEDGKLDLNEKKKSLEPQETSEKDEDRCDEIKGEESGKLVEFKETSSRKESEKDNKCAEKENEPIEKKKFVGSTEAFEKKESGNIDKEGGKNEMREAFSSKEERDGSVEEKTVNEKHQSLEPKESEKCGDECDKELKEKLVIFGKKKTDEKEGCSEIVERVTDSLVSKESTEFKDMSIMDLECEERSEKLVTFGKERLVEEIEEKQGSEKMSLPEKEVHKAKSGVQKKHSQETEASERLVVVGRKESDKKETKGKEATKSEGCLQEKRQNEKIDAVERKELIKNEGKPAKKGLAKNEEKESSDATSKPSKEKVQLQKEERNKTTLASDKGDPKLNPDKKSSVENKESAVKKDAALKSDSAEKEQTTGKMEATTEIVKKEEAKKMTPKTPGAVYKDGFIDGFKKQPGSKFYEIVQKSEGNL